MSLNVTNVIVIGQFLYIQIRLPLVLIVEVSTWQDLEQVRSV